MYVRGGKVWVSEKGEGWVALAHDWDNGRLPIDLVEEHGLMGVNFKPSTLEQRADFGGYVQRDNQWFFFLSDQTIDFHGISGQNLFCASKLTGWLPVSDWQLTRVEGGYGLTVCEEQLACEREFSFKFLTETGYWIEPHAQFPSHPESEGNIRNNWFDRSRTGRDLLSFECIDPLGNIGLEHWVNFRPEGNFGFLPSESSTLFRLFAPRAHSVEILFYKGVDRCEPEQYPLSLSEDGCWTVSFDPDFPGEGTFYKFLIRQADASGKLFEHLIVDPYARALVGRDGPGITVWPKKKKSHFSPPAKENVVLLEAHLRDLLARAKTDLSPNQRREFNGLTQWLSSPDCYLREIGVNVVELQPVQEFDARTREEYHWGYMPVNFFSPASSYASDPQSGKVVEEFGQMVDAFHEAGIAVVLDVVYNHVGIPPHLLYLDRELYFTTAENGQLTNHSGCGNDLRCEAEPVKKLIIDSLVYWVEHFDIDGFRFDLGEILGIELLAEIEEVLKTIKPGILLYAEPWSFRGRLPLEMNQTGYSLWSDACREELLNYVQGHGRGEQVRDLLEGILDRDNHTPLQSVNYLESHDDFALVDRFRNIYDWGPENTLPTEVVSRVMIAMGLLMVSPGVPMMSAGQDFLRHKCGVRNTYQQGNLNALEYEKIEHYIKEATFIRKLIQLRLSNPGCRARQSGESKWETYFFPGDSDQIIAFGWISVLSKESYLVLANRGKESHKLDVPSPFDQIVKTLASYGADLKDPMSIQPLSFAWYQCA